MTERQKTGGRQKGTPNKATAQLRKRITDADPIGFLIKVANGDSIDDLTPSLMERTRAAEWLGRKIAPDAKERPVLFSMPVLNEPDDALKAIGGVIEAMGAGNVTPSEASAVCNVINQYLKAYELNEMDNRLTQLENSTSIKGRHDQIFTKAD